MLEVREARTGSGYLPGVVTEVPSDELSQQLLQVDLALKRQHGSQSLAESMIETKLTVLSSVQ